MTASSSSELHMTPCFTLPFDWQTPSKWFCLLHALHVWPYAGHIRGRSPDPVLPCGNYRNPYMRCVGAVFPSCSFCGYWWYLVGSCFEPVFVGDMPTSEVSLKTFFIKFWSYFNITNSEEINIFFFTKYGIVLHLLNPSICLFLRGNLTFFSLKNVSNYNIV